MNTNKTTSSLFKLILLFSIPLITATVLTLYLKSEYKLKKSKEIVLTGPMVEENTYELGTVMKPYLEIPIKTQTGYKRNKFLIDTGATISLLPKSWADSIGIDLAQLKRMSMGGVGGKDFTYCCTNMVMLINEEEKEISVAFSKPSIIGRMVFFQEYDVYFDHKEKKVKVLETKTPLLQKLYYHIRNNSFFKF